MLETVRRSVIGADEAVPGPWGPRRVTYADYTASGRALSFVEDFVREAVLPLYANTHSESSATGLQTTRFREEARALIREAVGGRREEHAVVFCGSGATGAVDRLVRILDLRLPADLDRAYGLSERIPAAERPVVFIGPYEHHSNDLPWRESVADVVTIGEDPAGGVDLAHLERELRARRDRPLKIGSFSAASNVTGIVSNVSAVSSLLHQHGALSFWDFAAAAPYVDIEMSPGGGPAVSPDYKDAIFLSPHKFVGGPGTPGLLVARRELFTNRVPAVPGGGSVWFVTPTDQRYLDDPEHREEAGTPDIVGSIRAGLVFGVKEAVGADLIRERERAFIRRAIDTWSAHPKIEVLGNREAERLSIVSFVVRHGDGRHLHHNFVVALLNDLFGIQARGGCSCAGPYGHRLLSLDDATSRALERQVGRGREGIKPGWVRVNFNYFLEERTFRFVLEAVRLVAEHGAALLDRYRFDPETGLWRHRDGPAAPPLSLQEVEFTPEGLRYGRPGLREPASRLDDYLAEARELLEAAGDEAGGGTAEGGADAGEPSVPGDGASPPDAEFERLRWFPVPGEGAGRPA